MRKQIAAANWKMNLTYQQAEKLLDDILDAKIELTGNQLAIFAVPFPYLVLAGKYGAKTADEISILYGGSVKASNAVELFACRLSGKMVTNILW